MTKGSTALFSDDLGSATDRAAELFGAPLEGAMTASAVVILSAACRGRMSPRPLEAAVAGPVA